MTDHHHEFKDRTRLANARETLLDDVVPVESVESVPVTRADGRVLAETVTPSRAVPHYERAAMDGFAVVAESTFGASERSPTALEIVEADAGTDAEADAGSEGAVEGGDARSDGDAPRVDRRTARRVHTGSELPDGANAVVMVEDTEVHGGEVEVRASVTDGENVAPAGEDVPADAELFADGHRLRPSDLGLLRSVGRRTVDVYDPPTVEVVPTGDELVDADPDPGEIVETNALTVSRYVERWGGQATYRDVVPDDPNALRAAVERGLTADIVVTTGGSSVGERDLIADVVADRGEIRHHGVSIKPGHPVAVGVVEDTPVLMLPGYPVSCIVTAFALLRPALKHAGHLPTPPHPATTATLDRKIASEPGVRTFVRVALEPDGDAPGPDDQSEYRAVPIRSGGAGVLSSVTEADGWVTIPESVEGLAAGESVEVEHWEYQP